MTTVYKLTDENARTRGGLQWGPNVTHSAKGLEGKKICTDGWIHCYSDPVLAILMNPIGANFANPRLWKAEGIIGISENGLKEGCRTLTTIEEIPVPNVTTNMRVAFTILCAKTIYEGLAWNNWADNWLNNSDRTREAAQAAQAIAVVYAAHIAAYAAEHAAQAVQANTAYAAANASQYAAQAAQVAGTVLPIKDLVQQALFYA